MTQFFLPLFFLPLRQRVLLLLFCLSALVVASCGKSGEEAAPSTPDPKVLKASYAPYELVQIKTAKDALGSQPFEGTINGLKVQVTPRDTMACFLLPDMPNGSYTLSLPASDKSYSVPVTVAALTNVQGADVYFNAVEVQMTSNLANINAQADALLLAGGPTADLQALKQNAQKYATLLNNYKADYQRLSVADKLLFAKVMAANKPLIDEYQAIATGLSASATALQRTTQSVQDYEAEVDLSMKAYVLSVAWTVGHIPLILTSAGSLAAAPNPVSALALGITVTSFLVNVQQTAASTGILLNKALKPYTNPSVLETDYAAAQEKPLTITTRFRSLFQGDETSAPGGGIFDRAMEKYLSFKNGYNDLVGRLPAFLKPTTTTINVLKAQFTSRSRNIYNRYIRIGNVSNPAVTLTQLNQPDGSVKLRATTTATSDQTVSYDLTYANGDFAPALTQRVNARVRVTTTCVDTTRQQVRQLYAGTGRWRQTNFVDNGVSQSQILACGTGGMTFRRDGSTIVRVLGINNGTCYNYDVPGTYCANASELFLNFSTSAIDAVYTVDPSRLSFSYTNRAGHLITETFVSY